MPASAKTEVHRRLGRVEGSVLHKQDVRLPAGKPVGATQTTMRLISYAVDRGEPWSTAEAARSLALNPSTCFNVVKTLVSAGYLDMSDDHKRYVIGASMRALAHRLMSRLPDLSPVMPMMQAIADRWKLTVTIWHRRSPTRMELVAVATCNNAVNIQMPIGQKLPLLVGGMGRIMALHGGLTDQQRQAAFDEVQWQRPLSMATLMTQARQARRIGWGLDDGYMHRSVSALGVPVRPGNRAEVVEYVCSATMFRHQYARVAMLSIAEALRPVAARVALVVKPEG
ncbi:MAG: IclR family transcriptional regulator C-terminal domain-containing protein [Ideonella sp.]